MLLKAMPCILPKHETALALELRLYYLVRGGAPEFDLWVLLLTTD